MKGGGIIMTRDQKVQIMLALINNSVNNQGGGLASDYTDKICIAFDKIVKTINKNDEE